MSGLKVGGKKKYTSFCQQIIQSYTEQDKRKQNENEKKSVFFIKQMVVCEKKIFLQFIVFAMNAIKCWKGISIVDSSNVIANVITGVDLEYL